ncbi:NEDD8-conjugating enzyme Ubc12 [Gracilariopsis chorda]|uniref:NEDD8-conjugating enzyme Ubc12 n=1 Tax=Gracilariopsis chorda TaxID=448386 RepID=A0A2V3IDK0_9FLOR|nr:NEDD8-conjugating enzyme Ubc12 [Gracilariopsis chorda]|eukprot:PXF40153.1 NEDD8-conjugating enzyme Ubc12 [Gracilariopsis chorda]
MFRLTQQVKETRIRRETGAPLHKAGHIRVQKDISELDTPPSMHVSFPDPDDIMNFNVALSPEEGYYHSGTFHFTVSVPDDYPHKPPKVKCSTLVYHPNIDLDGNVCLNILRQDWKPVLSLSSLLYGLQLLFLEPNPDDPLNKDAANLLKRDSHAFQRNVAASVRGGYVAGTYFPSARRR